MKSEEFIDGLPDLARLERDGDKWCIAFFSRIDNGYRISVNLDSGDALIVIQELIDRFGIHPQVLAEMQKPDKPFAAEIPGLGGVILTNPKND